MKEKIKTRIVFINGTFKTFEISNQKLNEIFLQFITGKNLFLDSIIVNNTIDSIERI